MNAETREFLVLLADHLDGASDRVVEYSQECQERGRVQAVHDCAAVAGVLGSLAGALRRALLESAPKSRKGKA